MRQRWTRLFQRRCPMRRTEVRSGSAGAVRGCGPWCCSQSHADADACRLYDALAACQCRHATRHRVAVPRLRASTMHVAVSGASGVGPGQPRSGGIWFAACRVAGGLSSVGDEG
jgi:hypothetical protein